MNNKKLFEVKFELSFCNIWEENIHAIFITIMGGYFLSEKPLKPYWMPRISFTPYVSKVNTIYIDPNKVCFQNLIITIALHYNTCEKASLEMRTSFWMYRNTDSTMQTTYITHLQLPFTEYKNIP